MRSGPKPRPAKLKILEGNPGKRRILEEPKPPSGKPEPPSHLDPYGLEEWNRVVDGLFAMGVLSVLDHGTLAAYCYSYSQWRGASEALNDIKAQKGFLASVLMPTKSGNIIQHPLVGICNKAAADMARYASEYAMTPSARARLAVEPIKGEPSKFKGLIGVVGGKR